MEDETMNFNEIKLKIRSIVSLSQLAMGIFLLLSGIILYIAPSGRGSNEMMLLFMTKADWRYWHTVIGFIMAGTALIHVDLNFRTLRILTKKIG